MQQLNLSSRPFRNRTLPWLAAAVLVAVAGLGAFWVTSEWRQTVRQTAEVNGDIHKIEPQIKNFNDKADELRAALSPEQQQLLAAAHILVDRKRFSWSRLFNDLESVLPREVTVSNIAVRDVYQSRSDGDEKTRAELELAVLSKNYESVAQMIETMNNSGIFSNVELRGQDLQPDKKNMTQYSLHLLYSPRAGVAPRETANIHDNNDLAGVNRR